ncbi:MAG TPA: protein-glutamate O-methyltransferase [Candidatus Binatia bacterium]|nr:protein-glutamate O-methyltransferase [Candidatus Binatia bacterium]
MKAVSDREFSQFQRLIYTKAGIYLTPAKKALLEARLGRRLRDLGMESFSAYYEYVTQNLDGEELSQLLDRVSTNETHFFREPRQFEFLKSQVFPQWEAQAKDGLRPQRIRVWSAGCSTGEEPFSLAMTLLDHFPTGLGWKIQITATDLSCRAVSAAQKAIWPIAKAKEIPENYLKQFMLQGFGNQQGYMKAGPEICSIVTIQCLNLNDERYSLTPPFDLIFCRNVMIYFDAEARARIVHRLLNFLAPEGYLFVGHAESLSGVSDRIRHVTPTVYVLASEQNSTSNGAAGMSEARAS